jgi:predicted ArsR family transcriptional regulator
VNTSRSTGDAPGGSSLHRALSDPTRLALISELGEAVEPLDVYGLAQRVGVHVNTVRWHLRILVDAGVVLDEPGAARGRGRPRHAYRLSDRAREVEHGRFGLLAEVLVDALAHGGPEVAGTLEESGRVRGRELVRPDLGGTRPVGTEQALDSIVRLLARLGFEPRLEHGRAGPRIEMRPCPFGELAARSSSVVCPVHLGLIRGTLEALDAPVEAAELEPFVRPDLCVARFRPRAVSR